MHSPLNLDFFDMNTKKIYGNKIKPSKRAGRQIDLVFYLMHFGLLHQTVQLQKADILQTVHKTTIQKIKIHISQLPGGTECTDLCEGGSVI